jgi:hypothetical protein
LHPPPKRRVRITRLVHEFLRPGSQRVVGDLELQTGTIQTARSTGIRGPASSSCSRAAPSTTSGTRRAARSCVIRGNSSRYSCKESATWTSTGWASRWATLQVVTFFNVGPCIAVIGAA